MQGLLGGPGGPGRDEAAPAPLTPRCSWTPTSWRRAPSWTCSAGPPPRACSPGSTTRTSGPRPSSPAQVRPPGRPGRAGRGVGVGAATPPPSRQGIALRGQCRLVPVHQGLPRCLLSRLPPPSPAAPSHTHPSSPGCWLLLLVDSACGSLGCAFHCSRGLWGGVGASGARDGPLTVFTGTPRVKGVRPPGVSGSVQGGRASGPAPNPPSPASASFCRGRGHGRCPGCSPPGPWGPPGPCRGGS